MQILPILAALFVMSASLAGVLFTSGSVGRWMHRHLHYLATFSAGVLAVLAYSLVAEALHESASILYVSVAVLGGIALVEIIHWMLPEYESHHHHEAHHDHAHTAVDGRRVLVSDAVHNVIDGFVIVPAFLADWRIGVAATLGIFFHEVVQEISEFFILKEAGYTTKRALQLNLLASATILIGVGAALTLASSELFVAILSAVAAGGFVAVLVRDLLPHTIHSARTHASWGLHIGAIVAGMLLMLGVSLAVPHADASGSLACEDKGYCEPQV